MNKHGMVLDPKTGRWEKPTKPAKAKGSKGSKGGKNATLDILKFCRSAMAKAAKAAGASLSAEVVKGIPSFIMTLEGWTVTMTCKLGSPPKRGDAMGVLKVYMRAKPARGYKVRHHTLTVPIMASGNSSSELADKIVKALG